VRSNTLRAAGRLSVTAFILAFASSIPWGAAQSSQVAAEWALFDQILYIGIAVGIVVFGLMFYALIRYREKTPKQSGQ
jgi:heme/copper-type cytochrome/quinol oxidase subunit 2